MFKVSSSSKILLALVLLLLFVKPAFARESLADRETKALVLRDFLLTLDLGYLRCAERCDWTQEDKKIQQAWVKLKPLIPQRPKLDALFSAKPSLEVWRQYRKVLEEELSLNLAPSSSLNKARGEALFLRHCGSCHGATGQSDGALSSRLRPPLRALNSAFYRDYLAPAMVYNIVLTGIPKTPMYPFKDQISDLDMWTLAFYTLTLSAGDLGAMEQGAERRPLGGLEMKDASRLNGLELKALGMSQKQTFHLRMTEVFGNGIAK